jgi:hypothetical protein
MTYRDKHGEFFGRLNESGNVNVLHVEDGYPATRLDAGVYPVGSRLSARYEHAAGVVLTWSDSVKLGIDIKP